MRGVYLRQGSQSLGGRLLLVRSLLCSLQDVLKTTNNFLFLQRKNSIDKIHFFHRKANKVIRLKQGVPVCLLMGQEAVTRLSRRDYAGMRTFLKAKHRDEDCQTLDS